MRISFDMKLTCITIERFSRSKGSAVLKAAQSFECSTASEEAEKAELARLAEAKARKESFDRASAGFVGQLCNIYYVERTTFFRLSY